MAKFPDSDGAAALRGQRVLSTGDMARLSHTTVRTVRFYEESGVLRPAERSEGNHRLFPSAELDRLLFALDLREAGLALDEIKALLDVKDGAATGADAATQVRRVLTDKLSAIDDKIAQLTRLRGELVRTAEQLGGCATCTTDSHFPDQCGACERMKHEDPTRAVRVLWLHGVEPPA